MNQKKYTNDPALIPQYVSSSLLSYHVYLKPCQPLPNELINNIFPVKTDYKYKPIFPCIILLRILIGTEIQTKRLWLSYSP